jgi:replicative DNA helicase
MPITALRLGPLTRGSLSRSTIIVAEKPSSSQSRFARTFVSSVQTNFS